jgi:hypothetical protein
MTAAKEDGHKRARTDPERRIATRCAEAVVTPQPDRREGCWPMRRASACQTLLVLACLAFAATASAAPTVTLKITAIPIPGFPGTGNILGAGAGVEAQVTISGTEYGGFPSPLTRLTFYAPAGVKVASRGFASCTPAVLEDIGATGCPKHSRAGPTGEGLGVVQLRHQPRQREGVNPAVLCSRRWPDLLCRR